MAGAEAGNAGQLLILLDQGLGFAGNVGGRDLHLDFPPGAATGFSGAHVCLSVSQPAVSGAHAQFGPPPSHRPTVLSVKTEGEHRQTPEAIFRDHFGTLVTAPIGVVRALLARGLYEAASVQSSFRKRWASPHNASIGSFLCVSRRKYHPYRVGLSLCTEPPRCNTL
jgi:hypothetical protein